MCNLQLTKSSSDSDLKRYFTAVLELSKSDNKFPINLDEVWPLVYAERGVAVKALKKNFFENEDFISLDQNVKREIGASTKTDYYLSLSCMEYFIARKVRPVFEVYRQVFHKTANAVSLPSYQISDPIERAKRWIAEQEQVKQLQLENKKQKQLLERKQIGIEVAHQIIQDQEKKLKASEAKSRVYDKVIDNAQQMDVFTTRQIAQEINLSDHQLYAILMQIGLIYKQSGTYMMYAQYIDWGLHKVVSHVIDPDKGSVRTYLKWTNRGRAYIHALHDCQWDKRKAYNILKGTDINTNK